MLCGLAKKKLKVVMNHHQMETKHELAEMHRAADKPEGIGTLITSQPLIWTEGSTGVGNLSLLQGIFPTQGSNSGLPHCRQIFFYQLSLREAQEYWSG